MRKVVSQDSSVHSCLSLKVGALFLSMLLCTSAIATPVGGIIDGGEAVITHPNSVTTNINQTTNRASINWQEFNVYDGETVNFIQLDSNSITLNRVQGGLGASQIYGTINSNGHVWILNPEGVHFRAGSSVNVAGVLASTYNIATQNFMDGNYQFERFPGNHNGYAKNAGDLRVTSLAALLSHDVENVGYVYAETATVMLGSNPTWVLDVYGNDTINFAVSDELLKRKATVSNSGEIYADGGRVFLTVDQAESVVVNVINVSGNIHADTVDMQNGIIVLSGGDKSLVHVSGKLSAKGAEENEAGGRVHVTGELVGLFDEAVIDVSGQSQGGEILLGGDYQGLGELPTAERVYVGENAGLIADGYNGDAGKIIVWSDAYTAFHGEAYARALGEIGDGGFVETSSKGVLNLTNSADVSSANGEGGTWLLDPYDFEIVDTGGLSVGSSPFESTSTVTQINSGLIVSALDDGNVVIQTGSGGGGLGDITLSTSFTYASIYDLELRAINNISFGDFTIVNASTGSINLHAGINSDGIGTVIYGTGFANVTGGGEVNIYYNPTDYTIPVTFANADNAYMLIHDVLDLQDMNDNLLGSYALSKDIDARPIANFIPVGKSSAKFEGKFDGQNFEVIDLTIKRPGTNNVGMFGYVLDGTIDNVGLKNANVEGKSSVGALVGYIEGDISNAHSSGVVKGANRRTGALVGYARSGTISDSNSSADVTGTSREVGGLVGLSYADISDSFATGIVMGFDRYVGGLVGFARDGSNQSR